MFIPRASTVFVWGLPSFPLLEGCLFLESPVCPGIWARAWLHLWHQVAQGQVGAYRQLLRHPLLRVHPACLGALLVASSVPRTGIFLSTTHPSLGSPCPPRGLGEDAGLSGIHRFLAWVSPASPPPCAQPSSLLMFAFEASGRISCWL